MAKFHIIDEDENKYVVEEIEEDKDKTTTDEDINSLTSDEISALKSLASVAPKILELLKVEEKEHEAVSDDDDKDDCDKDITDDKDEDDEDDEDLEKVINTEDSIHDSVGKITKRKTSTNDSLDVQNDIAQAWANRYKGGNR